MFVLGRCLVVTSFSLLIFVNPAAASLIAYYNFDADDVSDSSGNSYDGTANSGVSYVDSQEGFGRAASFNGTDGFISLINTDLNSPDMTSFTFSAWIKPETPTGRTSPILRTSNGDRYGEPGVGVQLNTASDLEVAFRTSQDAPKTELHANDAVIADSDWHHIAFVRDSDARIATVFLDGVEAESRAFSDTNDIEFLRSPELGHGVYAPVGFDGFYHGLMDEVQIYSAALSSAEIEEVSVGPGAIPDPEPRPEAKITVFLDYGTDIDAGFTIRDKWLSSDQEVELDPDGSHPAADMSAFDTEAIASVAQRIFDDSNMASIHVVTDRSLLPEDGQYYSVKFGEALPTYIADGDTQERKGQAYDTGVDLFDIGKDGNVAVFIGDTGANSGAEIAETIAHEIGHALGLLHLETQYRNATNEDGELILDRFGNPIPLEINSVMTDDTGIYGNPAFLNIPSDTIELGRVFTQNPEFAVRYFALGEPKDSITDPNTGEALTPGSLDLAGLGGEYAADTAIDVAIDSVLISFFGVPGLTVAELLSKDYFGGAFPILRKIEASEETPGAFVVDMLNIFNYEFFGASEENGILNLLLGINEGDEINTLLGADDFAAGNIGLYAITSTGLEFLGDVDTQVLSSRLYFAPTNASVPSPSVLTLLACGILLAGKSKKVAARLRPMLLGSKKNLTMS